MSGITEPRSRAALELRIEELERERKRILFQYENSCEDNKRRARDYSDLQKEYNASLARFSERRAEQLGKVAALRTNVEYWKGEAKRLQDLKNIEDARPSWNPDY